MGTQLWPHGPFCDLGVKLLSGKFIRNRQTLSQGGRAVLCPHGRRVGIPVVQSSSALVAVSLWVVAHTVDLKCLFIVILTCISLMINDNASLAARMVKKLPAVWETWVRSLGWEDPLGKEMAT